MGSLRYNSPDSPVWHRTVRWASGATAPYVPTVDCSDEQWWTVPWQKSERRSQRSLDCPVQQKDKELQQKTASNPNGRADVACTGQWTMTVRCATGLSGVPIASRLCQRLESGWGYKYPQPPHSLASKCSEFNIKYKSKRLHSKTHSLYQNPLQVPKSTPPLSDLRERELCSFALLLLGLPFFLSILILKWFVKLSKRHLCVWWSLRGLSDPFD
jgi:hypothetical protein